MTEQKRPTLADHAASIQNLVSSVEHIAADIEEIKRPKTDFETSVAGRCATALDALKKAHADRDRGSSAYASLMPSNYNSSTGYNYQSLYFPPTGPVARVLDYLRQRYDLPDPSIETRRLSAELERAYGRMRELEARLDQIRGASA